MHILADENIPLVDEFFAGFGEIRRMPGRSINRAALENVDVLLVRSVTRVDREMLEGSAVRFVGTCTIGTDHLDLGYFEQAGIEWASAPGCNARGVVDYRSEERRVGKACVGTWSSWWSPGNKKQNTKSIK